MNKETFIQEAKEKRKKNIDELVLKVLAKMLKDDLRYFDAHYISNRTQEILEKTVSKLKFKSEDIQKARRAFLDVLLEGAKKQLYGFDDDYEAAKENLKIKSEKAKAKEVLRKIERLKAGKPEDLTEKRDMECEPVCQMIASEILSKELMLKDEDFVNGCIEMDNETLLNVVWQGLFNELIDQLISSLDKSYMLANEEHWGCRRDQITLKMIDNRIK